MLLPRKPAVTLLSGGLDSATVTAIALHEGYQVTALTFDYGQRHRRELSSATSVARALGVVDHRVVRVDLQAIGGSALTSPLIDVPKAKLSLAAPEIPATYVPARNTIFLAIALGLAETLGAFDLFFGANAVDYSGYPDCRPAFVEAFEALANVATRDAIVGRGRYRIHAPLMKMSKADIVRRGIELGVDYGLTHSCYDPIGDAACGACDSCVLRRRGFDEAGAADPIAYAESRS